MTQFHQCRLCESFCTDAGEPLASAPASWSELLAAANDGRIAVLTCEKCKVNPPAPEPLKRVQTPPKVPAVHNKTPCHRKAAPKRQATLAAGMRGCPQDTEPVHDSSYEPVEDSSQATYDATGAGTGAVEKLLAHFKKHRDEWIPMVELMQVAGVAIIHSRIDDARELIDKADDIDQKPMLYKPTGRVHSFYRLCAKSQSTRLQRKRDKDGKGQQELTGVGAQKTCNTEA